MIRRLLDRLADRDARRRRDLDAADDYEPRADDSMLSPADLEHVLAIREAKDMTAPDPFIGLDDDWALDMLERQQAWAEGHDPDRERLAPSPVPLAERAT